MKSISIQFKKLAKEMGVSFQIDSDQFTMQAPKDKIFRANAEPSYIWAGIEDPDEKISKTDIYKNGLEILSLGLE